MHSIEDAALAAIDQGVVRFDRDSFEVGEVRAVAIDKHADFAAVLVVERTLDNSWVVDVVRYDLEGGAWTFGGNAGGGFRDLPDDASRSYPPEIVVITTQCSALDERILAIAGGFVVGPVDEIEIVTNTTSRRVDIRASRPAFVVIAPASVQESPTVRSFSKGALVDDSADWRRERESAFEGTLTVAEALAAKPDDVVRIRGVLLVLEGQEALICDDIDMDVTPPRPAGGAIVVPGLSEEPSWTPELAALSTTMVILTGRVRDGRLDFVPPDPPTPEG